MPGDRTGSVRLGYIRQGSRVPVIPEAHVKSNCKEGWYELVQGGFVCGKYASLDLNHLRLKVAPHAPTPTALAAPTSTATTSRTGRRSTARSPRAKTARRSSPGSRRKRPSPVATTMRLRAATISMPASPSH